MKWHFTRSLGWVLPASECEPLYRVLRAVDAMSKDPGLHECDQRKVNELADAWRGMQLEFK